MYDRRDLELPATDRCVIALWPTDWDYISARGGREALTPQDVRATLVASTLYTSQSAARERFYALGPGPTAWLRVVVQWSGLDGRVYNAVPMRRVPLEDARLWRSRSR